MITVHYCICIYHHETCIVFSSVFVNGFFFSMFYKIFHADFEVLEVEKRIYFAALKSNQTCLERSQKDAY